MCNRCKYPKGSLQNEENFVYIHLYHSAYIYNYNFRQGLDFASNILLCCLMVVVLGYDETYISIYAINDSREGGRRSGSDEIMMMRDEQCCGGVTR